jgi:hypothetical protein
VGMAAATVCMLRLPLSAIVIAGVLTIGSGAGSEPLVIIAVIVADLIVRRLAPAPPPPGPAGPRAPAPAGATPLPT